MDKRTYLRLLLLVALFSMLISAPATQPRSSVQANSYLEMPDQNTLRESRMGRRLACPPGTRECPGGDCVPLSMSCIH
jgi:hypothetical protein